MFVKVNEKDIGAKTDYFRKVYIIVPESSQNMDPLFLM